MDERPWYETLAPDGDLADGPRTGLQYDAEELNAENRREAMAKWKRFEDSDLGVWLDRHTRLYEALSDEESVLVKHVGAIALLLAVIATLFSFVMAGGDPLTTVLACLPWWVGCFVTILSLWIFWGSYRDSGERAADWLGSRPGMASWRQIADAYGPRSVMRDVVPAVLPRTLSEFQERRPGAVMPKPWHAAMLVGWSHHMEVWLGCERHLYVLGTTSESIFTFSPITMLNVVLPGDNEISCVSKPI